MATESPMRLVESSGARKWATSKDAATFATPVKNMAADELGLLLKGHEIYGVQRNMVPNRSGSAPPSIEGSFAAFGNLLAQQNSSLSSSLASLSSVIENCQSEEQLLADPSYFTYYCSNVNLNPRLPQPIVSRENRHLVRQIGGFGNNSRSTSFDDSGNGFLHLSKGSLSTHNEEDPGDDNSPQQASDDWEESTNALLPGQNSAFLAGRHKSLVDLIQEDFPRTPSPVYNLSQPPSHATTEEPIELDIQDISLDDLSINIKKLPESKSVRVDVCVEAHSEGANVRGLTANGDSSIASLQKKPYPHSMGSSPPPKKVEVISKDVDLRNEAVISCVTKLDASRSLLSAEDSKNVQQQPYSQRSTTYQVHGSQSQLITQGVSFAHSGMEKIPQAHPMFSSVEVQPVVRPPGLTPPLYTTAAAAAYMSSGNPFYPNVNPSGLYAPQYNLGGYALSSAFVPPFIAGYPSHAAIPMHFDATSAHSFNGRTAGVSTAESISHASDQHLNRFYGQNGLMVQSSFLDPLHMPYFQYPVDDAYGASGQYVRLTSAGVFGGQVDSFDSQKEPSIAAYMGDPKFQLPPSGSLSIPSPRIGGIPGSYYGSPPSIGVMPQFSASPLGSPVLPGSPAGGTNYSGRRNEIRFPQGSIRNAGVYSGWQGQRGPDSFNYLKKNSFLEELKSSNARNFDLSDIAGRIVEFSVDQHGSRFIQQKLEICSVEDKISVFKEVLPHASKLMTDVFGNYVIQKFFEHGSYEQRKELADEISGKMLTLSLQMYGCRVIQKALEVIELDQKAQLVHELDGHVMRCVRDQNGNHVIQKCIECIPTEKLGFIISAFRGQVANLSTHPYGCRVIQRVLEHCSNQLQSQCIVDEILESAYVLAQDQYGNYVTQHVLERGNPHERSQIINQMTGKIVHMSQHKYASNVVEKCLEHGDTDEQELLIEEILGQSEENDNLLTMMKDQFANYVIQKIIEISNDKQREVLLNRIRLHLHALKKYTYGKHIVGRFEQLSGEESTALEPKVA